MTPFIVKRSSLVRMSEIQTIKSFELDRMSEIQTRLVRTIDRSDFGVVRLSDVRFSAFHYILLLSCNLVQWESKNWISDIWIKLMQFNRPKAKICFISDSNRLLIDFFVPIRFQPSDFIVATIGFKFGPFISKANPNRSKIIWI